jgi:hypothetical protein
VSSKRRQALTSILTAALHCSRRLFQFALERPRPGEQAPVELVEIVARRKEHETAGDSDGDSNGAMVELNCEALRWH